MYLKKWEWEILNFSLEKMHYCYYQPTRSGIEGLIFSRGFKHVKGLLLFLYYNWCVFSIWFCIYKLYPPHRLFILMPNFHTYSTYCCPRVRRRGDLWISFSNISFIFFPSCPTGVFLCFHKRAQARSGTIAVMSLCKPTEAVSDVRLYKLEK